MDTQDHGQLSRSAADVYEEFFVPALFREWAPRLCDAAKIAPGEAVLDVACGTGILAREAATRVAASGSVIGLDRNEGMLTVARRMAPRIDWRQGRAEALPFADGAFDAVVSQFGLMFFEDRLAALSEMRRVTRPGGNMAVAVWNRIEEAPGYMAMTRLLHRLFGAEIAESLRAPYALGDRPALGALFAEAGIADASIAVVAGKARFPSIESWVHTDIRGWTLADVIDNDQYGRLVKAAKKELSGLAGSDGKVEFDHPALIATAGRA